MQLRLTDLPSDVFYTIFEYLDACDFLSLTSSAKALLDFRKDPNFWRTLTRTTFRLPPQPLLQADGARWQWLYKNLLTKTRAFTWGNNYLNNLGQNALTFERHRSLPPHRRRVARTHGAGWPMEMVGLEHVGVVADIQCGGWSTTLLNSIGQIYVAGTVNSVSEASTAHRDMSLVPLLSFPACYPPTTKERYEPSTAVQQYSTGRTHILALSDSGKIWMWTRKFEPAKSIKFLHTDLAESGRASNDGRVRSVVAGWDRSAAYVNGTGLVYWYGQYDSPPSPQEETDAALMHDLTIPSTSYRCSRSGDFLPSSPDAQIGEIINYIVLEGYLVFFTHLNKIFAYQDFWPDPQANQKPTELTTFYRPNETDFQIFDIQGSFRSFAIFVKPGAVLIGNKALLDAFCDTEHPLDPASLPLPKVVPALQNSSTISIAFGDHHFHAMHANGTISSFGTEPRGCGSLGLGSKEIAQLRGVQFQQGWSPDGSIDTSSLAGRGDGRRTVWFEAEKREWLSYMALKSLDQEAKARSEMLASGSNGSGLVFGEWFEREGRQWRHGPFGTDFDNRHDHEEGLGAYFALKVSAAGWHSAALVLVDEDKAEKIRQKYVVNPAESAVPINENANGEEAEGEEVAAPWDQLTSALSTVSMWVYDLGRQFLGLSNRDAAIPVSSSELADHTSAGVDENYDQEIYAWHDQPFPRLRLPNGEAMPGEIPLTSWRGEEPTFTIRGE